MRKRLVGNKQLRADTQATRATDSTIRIEKLNQIAEDQELENLEMIYELEYKLERMAGYVSRSLDDLRGVTLTGADLENINKTRDLIQIGLKKQLKQQMDRLVEGQQKKAQLESTVKQLHGNLKEKKRAIIEIRREIKCNNNDFEWARKFEQELEMHRVKHESSLKDRSVVMSAYRISQEKVNKAIAELSELEKSIKSKEQQIEQFEADEERYRKNAIMVEQYASLENYKLRMVTDYQQKGQLCQRMSRDRIQELVEVRANIAKIDEELKDVIAKNYEQKAFLRAGLQQREHDPEASEASSKIDDDISDSEELAKYNGDSQYLPPLESRWLRIKKNLDKHLFQQQPKRLSSYEDAYMNVARHSRKPTDQFKQFDEESNVRNSILLKPNSLNQIINKHGKLKGQAYQERLPSSVRRHQRRSSNTLRMENVGGREYAGVRRATRVNSELPLVAHNKSSLYATPKYINAKYPRQLIPRAPKLMASEESQFELVSVGESEDDPNFNYVEVELTKKQLETLNKARKK